MMDYPIWFHINNLLLAFLKLLNIAYLGMLKKWTLAAIKA